MTFAEWYATRKPDIVKLYCAEAYTKGRSDGVLDTIKPTGKKA